MKEQKILVLGGTGKTGRRVVERLTKLGKTITQIQRLLQLNLFKRQSMWELFDPPLIKHKSVNPQKMLFNFSQL